MSEARSDLDIDLMEYERLRCEIDSRTQLAFGLVTLNVTALGIGFSAISSFPDVVFGLAIISCILWMLYIDHSAQVQKIAAYIGLRLAPRLRAANQDVLGWEAFLRRLDAGGDATRRALGLRAGAPVRMYQTPAIRQAMNALFGGAAPVLIVLGAIRSSWTPHTLVLRLLLVGGAVLVWAYAVRFYLLERGTWQTITAAFATADVPPVPPVPPVP